MTEIDEQIQVTMLIRDDDVQPAAFLWNGHRYEIQHALIRKTRLGDVLRWQFSVTISGGKAELSFDTASLVWHLERIYFTP